MLAEVHVSALRARAAASAAAAAASRCRQAGRAGSHVKGSPRLAERINGLAPLLHHRGHQCLGCGSAGRCGEVGGWNGMCGGEVWMRGASSSIQFFLLSSPQPLAPAPHLCAAQSSSPPAPPPPRRPRRPRLSPLPLRPPPAQLPPPPQRRRWGLPPGWRCERALQAGSDRERAGGQRGRQPVKMTAAHPVTLRIH